MQRSPSKVAIVLVDHGSRSAETRGHLPQVAERVAAARPDWLVAHAHMEFGHPDLAAAIAACVEAGATEVRVHPFFLNEGLHVNETIPALVEAARSAHAGITIRLTAHLGLHDGVVDAVVDRIEASFSERED